MSEHQTPVPVKDSGSEGKPATQKNAGKKNGRKKRSLKKKLITLLVIMAVLGFTAYTVLPKLKTTKETDNYYTQTVSRGDIGEEVSGSGTVTPVEKLNVSTSASGEIVEDYIKEGQSIKAGDTLYVIDHGNVDNEIQTAQLNLQKAQQTYASTKESAEGMTVKAPFSGVLTSLNVAEGDSVRSGTVLAVLTDTSRLTITLPFNASDMNQLKVGDTASVILTASGDKLTGKVTRKYTGTTVTDTGAITSNVEVTVSDTNGIAQGDEAAVVVGGVSCNSPGTFAYADQKNITAVTDGTVETLKYRAGDTIGKGEVLLKLDNDQTLLTLSSNEMGVTNAETALENARNKLNNYIVKSTISGTVIEKSYAKGDDLEGFETLAVIADMSLVTFDISVDELDIASIKNGQSVSVTADALTDKEFKGKVTYVSSIGSTSSGVTTYPVTVTVDGGSKDGLMMDMNVTGVITVNSVSNVLRVPIGAVVRGNQVLVKTAAAADGNNLQGTKPTATDGTIPASPSDTPSGTSGFRRNASGKNNGNGTNAASGNNKANGANSANSTKNTNGANGSFGMKGTGAARGMGLISAPSGEIPEGYEYVEVTTGASNDTYIEIISGLSEGQSVAIPIAATESKTNIGGGMFGIGGMAGTQVPKNVIINGGMGGQNGNFGGNRNSGGSSSNRSSGSSSRGNG